MNKVVGSIDVLQSFMEKNPTNHHIGLVLMIPPGRYLVRVLLYSIKIDYFDPVTKVGVMDHVLMQMVMNVPLLIEEGVQLKGKS